MEATKVRDKGYQTSYSVMNICKAEKRYRLVCSELEEHMVSISEILDCSKSDLMELGGIKGLGEAEIKALKDNFQKYH